MICYLTLSMDRLRLRSKNIVLIARAIHAFERALDFD